jgi:hypothetical protein
MLTITTSDTSEDIKKLFQLVVLVMTDYKLLKMLEELTLPFVVWWNYRNGRKFKRSCRNVSSIGF